MVKLMKGAGYTLNSKRMRKIWKIFLHSPPRPVYCKRTFMLANRFEIFALEKLIQYESMELITEDDIHSFLKLARRGDTLSETDI